MVGGWFYGPDATGRYELGDLNFVNGETALALPKERADLLERL